MLSIVWLIQVCIGNGPANLELVVLALGTDLPVRAIAGLAITVAVDLAAVAAFAAFAVAVDLTTVTTDVVVALVEVGYAMSCMRSIAEVAVLGFEVVFESVWF